MYDSGVRTPSLVLCSAGFTKECSHGNFKNGVARFAWRIINKSIDLKSEFAGDEICNSMDYPLVHFVLVLAKGEQSILLILKWGGELTPAGRVQAEELGRAFRCIYPGGQGEYQKVIRFTYKRKSKQKNEVHSVMGLYNVALEI